MKRIDTAPRAANLFGAGKDGFQDSNAAIGQQATPLNAAFWNLVQEELIAPIEAAGIPLDATGATKNQLLSAIRALKNRQVYNAAGTFTFVVPAGIYLLDVEGWGGGGGGSGNPTNTLGGCGASGAYGRKLCAVTPAQSITVTIPAAAAGGAAGANNGQNGGTCSFGALLSVAGGGGGASSSGAGAAGGAAPTADIAIVGSGTAGILASSQAYGQGGSAPRGGAGGFITNAGGQVGNWPGGGGGSGYNSVSAQPGGAGAVGGFSVRW